MNIADLHREKSNRGFGYRLQEAPKPIAKEKEYTEKAIEKKPNNDSNNIWYMVFFWLLLLKLIQAIDISWAGVLCPMIFFFWIKVKSW